MKVVIAIITDSQQRILIAQRPLHASHGGFWEFPGGKIEPNETAQESLVREIREETGLEILESRFLGEIHHQYPNNLVQLNIFQVTQFAGEPSCLEGQLSMKWVEKTRINPDDFPEANKGILDLIVLPAIIS